MAAGLSDEVFHPGGAKIPKGAKAVNFRTDASTGGPMKSIGGGHLRVKVQKPVKVKAPKVTVPKVAVPTQPAGSGTPAPGAAGDPTSDPFAFIQSLMTSTDPAQARALVDSVYGPQRDLINQQIADLQASSQARAQQMAAIYQEFGQFIGPAMQQQMAGIYGPGSPSFTQGQADGKALAQGMLGPQGNVGNELATVTGNGGQDLSSQLGSIYGNLASKMPGIYSLYATQQIKQMLGAANANEATLRQDLLSLSSKEASDILSYLENAQANDTKLQEWAYGQKASQDAASAKYALDSAHYAAQQRQATLNYDQRQSTIAFNKWKVAQAQGDKVAAEQWKEAYQKASLQEKYDAMNATDRRAAENRAAANSRAAANRAAANSRAATAAAGKTRTHGQTLLDQTIPKITTYANSLKPKASAGGSKTTSGTVGYHDANGNAYTGKVSKQKNGTFLTPSGQQVWPTHVSKRSPGVAPVLSVQQRRTIWLKVYNYSKIQLFQAYRAMYPGLAAQRGQIQQLVNKRVTEAVGWGPKG